DPARRRADAGPYGRSRTQAPAGAPARGSAMDRSARPRAGALRAFAGPSHAYRHDGAARKYRPTVPLWWLEVVASRSRCGVLLREPLERALVLGHQPSQARLELLVVAARLDALVDRDANRLRDGHVVHARHRLQIRRKLVAEPQGHCLRHRTAQYIHHETSTLNITNRWCLGSLASIWNG